VKPFRFRAAAALERRRRDEDDAAAALARATARFHEAKAAHARIERERAAAQRLQIEHAARGIDAETLSWHRNWITRLHATLEQLAAETQRRSAAMDAAERVWRLARQRRLALDRLHDRSLARYRVAERQHDARVIDELARIRHTGRDADALQEEM
jgi:flagellar export protein FliJ